MSVEVLIATMNQTDHSLLDFMNVRTDVIVGNQCGRNEIESFTYNNHKAIYLNFAEKGVGLNRNNALMRANGDICLFADDDMIFVDNYERLIESAFKQIPDADVIVYNLKEKDNKRYHISKRSRVYPWNYGRYGAARIAIKLKTIKKYNIFFNQCFGGGTEHSHGEDNIFLNDCLRAGLKIYAVPITIAELVDRRQSTWNKGFNRKYLEDQGCLYQTLYRKTWRLFCFIDALRRHKKHYGISCRQAYSIMIQGAKE